MKILKKPAPVSKEYWDDYQWANRHRQELVKSHRNQWVGIRGKKVIVADPDFDRVDAVMSKRFPDTQVPLLYMTDAANVY